MDWKIIFIWVFPLGCLGSLEDINKLGDYAIAYNYIDEDAISKLESQHTHSQEQYTCFIYYICINNNRIVETKNVNFLNKTISF